MKISIFFSLGIIFVFILLTSCTDNNEDLNNCKITSCSLLALTYEDVNQIVSYNPNSSGKIYFEYDNQNRVNKIIGGFEKISNGVNSYIYSFFNDIETTINYNKNNIIVENSTFSVKDNKLNSRILTDVYNAKIEYSYEYTENTIQEIRNNKVYRTFYFKNNNLTKVEHIVYNRDNATIRSKTELIFSDYDNSKNLLKGLFFIKGAFYKAFSDNNFKTKEYKTYVYENNEFIDIKNGYSVTMSFELNENGIADIFEQNCN